MRGNRSHAAANQSENQPELYTTSPNGKPRCEAARSHFSHSMLIVLRLSRSKYFSIFRRKRRRTTRSMTLPFNYVAFTLTFAVIFRIELYSTWNMNTKGLNRTYRLKTTIRYDELRLRHAAWCRYIWGQSSHTHLGSLHSEAYFCSIQSTPLQLPIRHDSRAGFVQCVASAHVTTRSRRKVFKMLQN